MNGRTGHALYASSLVAAALLAIASPQPFASGSTSGSASSAHNASPTANVGTAPVHGASAHAIPVVAIATGASTPDSTPLRATPEMLAIGKRTYEQQCIACHGPAGDGAGEAAYLLYPKPRDFTTGKFALISTWERVPTDLDLFRTISRGMPGSAMPSWGHLPEATRLGLVHYIKTFATQPILQVDQTGSGGARTAGSAAPSDETGG